MLSYFYLTLTTIIEHKFLHKKILNFMIGQVLSNKDGISLVFIVNKMKLTLNSIFSIKSYGIINSHSIGFVPLITIAENPQVYDLRPYSYFIFGGAFVVFFFSYFFSSE